MMLNVLDLFSGCGGLSLGFRQAGFHIAGAIDMNMNACLTYSKNFPECKLVEGDIRSKEIRQKIIDLTNVRDIHIIIGGFPCQGFSFAGDRNPLDKRSKLYLYYLSIVKKIKPLYVVMENVKGLISMNVIKDNISDDEKIKITKILHGLQRYKALKRYGSQRSLGEDEEKELNILISNKEKMISYVKQFVTPLLPIIIDHLEKMGYLVSYKVLNARDYGSPQERERIFIVATRKKSFSFTDGNEKDVSVESVLSDLVGKPENFLLNHEFTKHTPEMLDKIKNTKPGSSVYEYGESWLRLEKDKLSKTVKENHGGVFVHYSEDRVLTPRELARLQDFPDNFEFCGRKSEILKQIGNAVPIKLAKAVAEMIMKHAEFNNNI